jgi:hypothetical protein
MYQYELIVCYNDGTWTTMNFIESKKKLTREEAELIWIQKTNGSTDFTYVGIYHEEFVEGDD